jgi:hypothetical protein
MRLAGQPVIPATLERWSLEVVRDLLSKGYYETDRFDFKEMLPRDADGRLRLAKTCCAFANSRGGFLIFGINAESSLPVEDRLVGLDRAVDFPVEFGPYPARCAPSLEWTFLNPPLGLPSGRVIQIIHVPLSWSGPHGVADDAGRWNFTKRTSQGNQTMSMEEIRAGFLGYYEKRIKLQLLRAELETIRRQAGEMIITGSDIDRKTSLTTFELAVLESVLSDTYTILAASPALLGKLREIRGHCRNVNKWVALILPVWHMPLTNKSGMISDHNLRVMADATNVARLVDEAMPLLDELTK